MTTKGPAEQDPRQTGDVPESVEAATSVEPATAGEAAMGGQGVEEPVEESERELVEEPAVETEREPIEEAVREPVVEEVQREVVLQRSVRYGRVIVVATVLGAVIGMLLSSAFPVAEEALYSMRQIVGFMAIIGAAIGLAVGGILSLVLGLVARRGRGTGVAIQTDVR